MELGWFVALGAAIGCLAYCFVARALCLLKAKKWFGEPHPGSIRLFGRGKLRPIQQIDALEVPYLQIRNKFVPGNLPETRPSTQRTDWAALGDGLVVGALAYSAVAASSDQARSVLATLPFKLDRFELNRDPTEFVNEAQRVGYESWIQGHIGESVAANVLTQNGHYVELAELPNQPGWDMIVDGVHMNIKVGETSATNIAEHFQKYPEIPVITDVHTAATLNHPDVYGVPGLEPDHIEQISAEMLGDPPMSAQETHLDAHGGIDVGLSGDAWESLAEGAAETGGGILDAGVPWFAIGASAFREDRLAKQYGADAAESAGAIAADVAGVGVGAKVGGAVGLLFGPLGGWAGAIAGALIGKYFVQNVRCNNLEAEMEELRPKIEEIETRIRLALRQFEKEFERVIHRWNKVLEKSTAPKRATFQSDIKQLLREHDRATLAFLDSVYHLFDVFDSWLDSDLHEIRRRFPARNALLRLLLPSSADAARELAEEWIAAKRVELHRWRDRFARFAAEQELTGTMEIKAVRQLIMEFFERYKVWDPAVAPILKKSVLKFEDIAKRATIAHMQVMKSILYEFQKCENSARQELHAKWTAVDNQIELMSRGLDDDLKAFTRRAARARFNRIPSALDTLARMRTDVKRDINRATSKSKQLARLPLFN